MRSISARIVGSFVIVGAVAVEPSWLKAPVRRGTTTRKFERQVASAKEAAGFEFQGALVRVCLQPPQIGSGEYKRQRSQGSSPNPASAPLRRTWYAEPAKVFDDFYFVGGKIHSAWALTTSEGIILIDTIYPYNSEELIVGGSEEARARPDDNQVRASSPMGTAITSAGPRCCRSNTARRS